MPLDRANVTVASRIMLPAYVALDALFAAAFLADPQDRLNLAPSLDIARAWMPIEQWGLAWFALTAFMVMALVVGHRVTFIVALALNSAAWLSWGVLLEVAVISQPNVTLLAGTLPWFVAVASFASMMSLLAKER